MPQQILGPYTPEGEDFLLKKAPLKTLRVLDPIKTLSWCPQQERENSNCPIGAIPHKAVTNRFLKQGETKLQRLQGSFSTPL